MIRPFVPFIVVSTLANSVSSLVPNPTYDPEFLAAAKATEDSIFTYSLQLYITQKPPLFGTVDPEEIQKLAGEKLKSGTLPILHMHLCSDTLVYSHRW